MPGWLGQRKERKTREQFPLFNPEANQIEPVVIPYLPCPSGHYSCGSICPFDSTRVTEGEILGRIDTTAYLVQGGATSRLVAGGLSHDSAKKSVVMMFGQRSRMILGFGIDLVSISRGRVHKLVLLALCEAKGHLYEVERIHCPSDGTCEDRRIPEIVKRLKTEEGALPIERLTNFREFRLAVGPQSLGSCVAALFGPEAAYGHLLNMPGPRPLA